MRVQSLFVLLLTISCIWMVCAEKEEMVDSGNCIEFSKLDIYTDYILEVMIKTPSANIGIRNNDEDHFTTFSCPPRFVSHAQRITELKCGFRPSSVYARVRVCNDNLLETVLMSAKIVHDYDSADCYAIAMAIVYFIVTLAVLACVVGCIYECSRRHPRKVAIVATSQPRVVEVEMRPVTTPLDTVIIEQYYSDRHP